MPRELPHVGSINSIDNEPIGYSEERGLESVSLTIGGERPPNPFYELLDAARAELKTAGEQTDLEILEAIPNDDPKALRSALSKWLQDIVLRQRLSGKPFLLSRLTKAARFVAEQKMVMINLRYSAHGLTDDEAAAKRFEQVHHFADVWCKWGREVFGDHDRAYEGKKAAENRAKGPGATRAKKERRRALILGVVGDQIDDHSVPCKAFAGRRIEDVNRALKDGGSEQGDNHKLFKSEDALTRELQRIRSERGGIGK